MNNSALDYLFGILGQESFNSSKEHARCIADIAALYEKFKNKLSGGELADFEKLCESFDGLNCEESFEYFKIGFKFAVRLMAESLA